MVGEKIAEEQKGGHQGEEGMTSRRVREGASGRRRPVTANYCSRPRRGVGGGRDGGGRGLVSAWIFLSFVLLSFVFFPFF